MSFVLPRGDGAAAPTPLDESEISIEDVPARLVAVAFPGLVTDEEVEAAAPCSPPSRRTAASGRSATMAR